MGPTYFFPPLIHDASNNSPQRIAVPGMDQFRDFMPAVKQLLQECAARIGKFHSRRIQIAADRGPWEILAVTIQLLKVSRQHGITQILP